MSINLRPSQALRLWQAVALQQVQAAAPDLSHRQMAILLTIYLDSPPPTPCAASPPGWASPSR